MNYTKFARIILAGVVVLIPSITAAHGPVTTQQATVNSYLIEFEYNTIGNIAAGDFTTYDVRIENPKTLETIPFDSAFIRIDKKDGPVILAGNLAQAQLISGNGASMSGIMPDPGVYTADVSFSKDQNELADAKFTFTVDKAYSYGQTGASSRFLAIKTKIPYLLSLILGLIIGIITTLWMKKKSKRS